jgi:hypothetical protein
MSTVQQKARAVFGRQNLNPLFHFNVNLEVNKICDHLTTSALGECERSLERLTMCTKKRTGDLVQTLILLAGFHTESGEADLPSKCRVSDATSDSPQHSSEEPVKRHVLQIVHKQISQLSSTFVAHGCTQILEQNNFLNRIVFSGEAKFHISGYMCPYYGDSGPPRECFKHKRNSPKANLWCALTYERVIDPFSLTST